MNSPSPAESPGAVQAGLEELRRSGRWRADPARFRYLEALARRIPAQPEPVRMLLQARFEVRLAQFAAQANQEDPVAARRAAASKPASPVAQLMQMLRAARPDAAGAAGRDELASARRFREAWDARRALEKLDLALSHRPAQAGPLNSHALVLQSLELMRTVSPQYLRQFVLHVETLQWLAESDEPASSAQRAGKKAAGKSAKTGKVGRTRAGK